MAKSTHWPIAFKHSSIPLLFVFIASIQLFTGDELEHLLVYHRSAIFAGEWWRLLTGHLLHTNVTHYFLNIGAIVLLWSLHGQFYQTKHTLLLFVGCALLTSLALLWLSPELTQYVGLSGLLHGVFVWGAVQDIRHNIKFGYLLFLGVWLKIAHEQLFGASASVAKLIDAPVAVDAHFYGALAGLCFALVTVKTIQGKVKN